MNKIFPDSQTAIQDIIKDDMMIAVGGFGLCGIPEQLIEAVHASKVKNLTCISNNAGVDGIGLSLLLEAHQVKKMIASYIGGNKEFERQYLSGELEVELTPQGTMVEKLRAAGAGIPAFYTKTGVGTVVQDGKETRDFNGQTYLLEESLFTDLALVKAYKADKAGNLVFRKTARNVNPDCAVSAKLTIAEVEHIVEIGELDPDEIHLPGIYVDRVVLNSHPNKHIEIRTVKTATI